MKKLQNTTVVVKAILETLTDLSATVLNINTRHEESGFGEQACVMKTVRFINGRKLVVSIATDRENVCVTHTLVDLFGRKIATSEYHSKDLVWGEDYAHVKACNDFTRKNMKYLRVA